MNTLEDNLRRVLADPPGTPPAWPDATERVRAGMRRRRRRHAALAAGIVTAVTMAAAGIGVGLVRGPSRPAPARPSPAPSATASADAIPWRDLPVVDHPPTSSPRPAAAPCRTGDLVLAGVPSNGAGGTEVYIVQVRNAGARRCTLAGRPTLLRTDAATGTLSVMPVTTKTFFPIPAGSTAATIDPGEQAQLNLETSNRCLEGRPTITGSGLVRLVVRLADGGRIALPTAVDATCGVALTKWYRQAPPAPPSRWAGVTASIEAPASVPASGTLDYVVVLTNQTAVDVPLDPCPSYIEGLSAVKAAGAYGLNCTVPAIPAGGSLRFAMRLAIPATAPPGTVTLTWSLDSAENAPQASGPLTITP